MESVLRFAYAAMVTSPGIPLKVCKNYGKEFRELAKKYHPDVSTGVQAADIFKEISAEYDLLRWSEENSSQ